MANDPDSLAIGRVTVNDVTGEVVDYQFPPEPPLLTVIVDAKGFLHQRVRWHHFFAGIPYDQIEWTMVGERPRRWDNGPRRPTWSEIVARGPVTILWQPSAEQIKNAVSW